MTNFEKANLAFLTLILSALLMLAYAYFIGYPLSQAADGIAATICQSWNLDCDLSKIKH